MENFDERNADTPNSSIQPEERNWGLAAHVTALAAYIGIPFGHILGPLIVWLVKKDEMPFVDEHGKESLNFQISMTIYMLACIPLVFVVVGIFLFFALLVADLVLVIIAAVAAGRGESYRYPATIRLIK